jgi:hypothetical protein
MNIFSKPTRSQPAANNRGGEQPLEPKSGCHFRESTKDRGFFQQPKKMCAPSEGDRGVLGVAGRFVDRNDKFSYLMYPKIINVDRFMCPVTVNHAAFSREAPNAPFGVFS